ncbi:MAG: hypothetical protein R3C01_09115 [Planctomycetaceae bacterium]
MIQHRFPRTVFAALCAVGLMFQVGCGGGGGDADPNLTSVTGKITAGGSPVTSGTIAFVSNDGKTTYSGKISEDGTYEIMASGTASGALPGDYKVGVTSWKTEPTMDADGKPTPGERAVDEKFSDPGKSGVTVTVEKGKSTYDIDLK